MEIDIEVKSVKCAADGVVTGNMTVNLNGNYIPENRWYDFVADVLAWWLREAQKFVSGERRLVFPFMDGPFELRFSDKGGGFYDVAFVQCGAESDTVLVEGEATSSGVIRELLRESESLLRHCEQMGLVSSDLENLGSAYSQLKRFTA